MVSPDQFIPVAEATRQIIEIGEWVLAHALDQLARWRCRALDLRVVAEGIETERQRITLMELGCAIGQGHHLGRPTKPGDATRFLLER